MTKLKSQPAQKILTILGLAIILGGALFSFFGPLFTDDVGANLAIIPAFFIGGFIIFLAIIGPLVAEDLFRYRKKQK